MNKQNFLFWISIAISALFGIFAIGFGIYLLIKGQDCRSYNDYACAFSAMFSFVIIPYGLAILAFVGLTSLPFRVARLMGAILSALTGFGTTSLCCFVMSWTASADAASLTAGEMMFFLFPLTLFIGGAALMGVGVTGFLKSRQ
jgi:hypothetical protein